MTQINGGICQSMPLTQRRKIMEAYSKWISNYLHNGYQGFLLTFMFQHLGENEKHVVSAMNYEIGNFYGKLLSRFNRKPRSLVRDHLNPILYTFPDRPVSKEDKQEFKDIKINNGLHAHGIALTKINARKNRTLYEDVLDHQRWFVAKSRLNKVHVVPISEDPVRVTSYAMKSFARGYFSNEDFGLYPKSISELPGETFDKHLEQLKH